MTPNSASSINIIPMKAHLPISGSFSFQFISQTQSNYTNPIIYLNSTTMMFYQSQKKDKTQYNSKLNYPEIQSEMNSDRKASQQQSRVQDSYSNMRGSVMLKDEPGEEPSCCTRLFSCTKLQNYKEYFKVTNDDVKKRIMSSLMFWKGDFFEPAEQDYDFYGPFWILTTVIFCLSAVPNILKYQVQSDFKFDFSVVGAAFGFVYVEGFLFPIIFTFVLKFLGTTFTHIQTVCLYGYSMSAMILCLLLCSLNSCLLHIIFLLVGCAWKAMFVLKNIMPKVQSARKLVVMVAVIGQAALIFFVFKLGFIVCQEQGTAFVRTSSIQDQINRLQQQLYQQQHLHQILRNFTHQSPNL